MKSQVIGKYELVLMFVAYHVNQADVDSLKRCLGKLPNHIGYAVLVNEFSKDQPINELKEDACLWISTNKNLGYGRGMNLLANSLKCQPAYIAALNTDIYWNESTFENILLWLKSNPQVVMAVPSIYDQNHNLQYLCKRNPTALGMISRRFIPQKYKPSWLLKYDNYYAMRDHSYSHVFESLYLSGCCMIMQSSAFFSVGGFDERFFLYLEDADLTRSMSSIGQCVHYPEPISFINGER